MSQDATKYPTMYEQISQQQKKYLAPNVNGANIKKPGIESADLQYLLKFHPKIHSPWWPWRPYESLWEVHSAVLFYILKNHTINIPSFPPKGSVIEIGRMFCDQSEFQVSSCFSRPLHHCIFELKKNYKNYNSLFSFNPNLNN